MVLSNETVLIQQHANDRGSGWGLGGKVSLKLKHF